MMSKTSSITSEVFSDDVPDMEDDVWNIIYDAAEVVAGLWNMIDSEAIRAGLDRPSANERSCSLLAH